MPPFLPRKRLVDSESATSSPRKRTRLSDVLDDEPNHRSDLEAARNFTLGEDSDSDSDSDSSLSDVSSDQFEDVETGNVADVNDAEGEDDEEVDWEDTLLPAAAENSTSKLRNALLEDGNLELNLSKDGPDGEIYEVTRIGGAKKGPTKIEREIRFQTHRMHVQFLLFHNAVRNAWVCDEALQTQLVKDLPAGIVKEVQKWRVASGLEVSASASESSKKSPSKGKKSKKGKGKVKQERSERDWGKPSTRLEPGQPDLSRGDPIIPLLKILAAYWKKRFSITAPGLRKQGYSSKAATQRLVRSFRDGEHDVEKHGEKIVDLPAFRQRGKRYFGSRDVGAQLFTALLRGLGIEARLVGSLQPVGFGWTKVEEASTVQEKKEAEKLVNKPPTQKHLQDLEREQKRKAAEKLRQRVRSRIIPTNRTVPSGTGSSKADPEVKTSDNDMESPNEDSEPEFLGITPKTKYDRDLAFPVYWTEVVSPITSKVIPVSSLVLDNPVATTPEILAAFEPRGAKAEKAKQVIAYIVAHSPDGSAKDVTTRYLKKQMWPGKTKGFRMPIEKVPVYNKRGKIKHTEDYDWFKSVMSGYVRTDAMRKAVDDVEESTDLLPQQPDCRDKKQDGDTLQSLRTSADFCLERFLRREEALRPEAEPVRTFMAGKGDKAKGENVYSRKDVERCLSAESWHKEGRQVQTGQTPLKMVPIRAVTLTRKREVEDMQRQTGEKPLQGLYSWDQTEYIIPPPIKNGVIPKNNYGNMDCFVPSMIPKGAVHLPMRGTVRICKKLEIDYAEAVTGFEFGNKMAIPVIEGVIVPAEHEDIVREAWEEYAEKQRIKEEGKLEKAVLTLWKRMLMGLRIRERTSETYGGGGEKSGDIEPEEEEDEEVEEVSPYFARGKETAQQREAQPEHEDEEMADDGGGGGFLLPEEEEADEAAELLIEDTRKAKGKQKVMTVEALTPVSMPEPVAESKAKRKGRPRRSTRGD